MANQITVDIVADTRNLVQGVKTTNDQLSSLNQSVGKLKSAFGGIAAAFGFQVGIGYLKEAIKSAAEEEATFKKLANLYGEDAQKVIDGIESLSKGLSIDDGAIAKYFLDLAAATDGRFKPFYNDIVTQSVRLGTVLGQPPEKFISAWTKALKDGKITAQEVAKLGIDLNDEQEAAFNKIKTTADRITFLLDIAAQQSKDAEKFVDPWQKLQFQFEQISEVIGQFLLPVLSKMIRVFESLPKPVQDIVLGVTALVVGLSAFAALVAPIVFVMAELGITWVAVKGAAIALGAAVKALGFAFFSNPWTVVILAIVAAGILLYKNWDTVKAAGVALLDKLKGIWSWIKDNWQTLLPILTGPIGAAVSVITRNWDSIKSAFSNTLNAIKALFNGDISAFTNFGRNIISGLVNGIRSMASAPIDAVKGIANGIKNAFTGLFGIRSPSKVFAGFGVNLVQGLAVGIDKAQSLADGAMTNLSNGLTLTPSFAGAGSRGGVVVNINAGLGTDPYELGRAVRAALNKYDGVNGR